MQMRAYNVWVTTKHGGPNETDSRDLVGVIVAEDHEMAVVKFNVLLDLGELSVADFYSYELEDVGKVLNDVRHP
jgi:hypothetical protein